MTIETRSRLIHVAVRQIGLDDATYRHILKDVAGVESSKDLDDGGFANLMDYFQRQGFRSTSAAKGFGHRRGMASPAQIATIVKLWADWSADGSEKSLNAWLTRSFHVSALRFLTKDNASKAINGLRAMSRRPAKKEAGNAAKSAS
jgi:phage gp16-like protein